MLPQGREPLLAYLKVQREADRAMIRLLNAAARDAAKAVAQLASVSGVGAGVRRDQLQLAIAAIKREQPALWREVGNEIAARRADVAATAAEQASKMDARLFADLDPAALAAVQRANMVAAKSALEILRTRTSGQSYVTLSQRVYRNAALANGRIDRIVNNALARGASAREIAADVRAFINPRTPGGTSYAAMRLGRTELNNAFHAATVAAQANKPWVTGQKWSLSGSHPKSDVCNDLAEADPADLGRGIYPPDDVPSKPHPQCFCYITAVTVSRAQFIREYNSGAYDTYVNSILAA